MEDMVQGGVEEVRQKASARGLENKLKKRGVREPKLCVFRRFEPIPGARVECYGYETPRGVVDGL